MEVASEHRAVPLRDPGEVMRLSRMGCFHQTRLSFMRSLLRKLRADNWRFQRTRWDVDQQGVGIAVYEARGPLNTYSLICYAHDLPPEKRTDRVIATQWDATFTLFDGVPERDDIERLEKNVPLQEAGHCSQSELVLARANRSVRLFEHVVEKLSRGCQPDRDMIDKVGYLMRTTAVYGNGKFGLGDRDRICGRPEFSSAFHSELLAVWLIRLFTVDIVEHMARVRGGKKSVRMNPGLRRRLGVGNSTGLGMAPFLIMHPSLIHSWMLARETALARVRSISKATAQSRNRFSELVSRMMLGVESWNTADTRQQDRIMGLKQDLIRLSQRVHDQGLDKPYPWDELVKWSEKALTMEGQELLVSLVIEPHGDRVDDLADTMAVDEAQYFPIDATCTVSAVLDRVRKNYAWALDTDYSRTEHCARFWYYSEEKLEPRVGERFDEAGADKEYPLAYARDVTGLYADLQLFVQDQGSDASLADFLLRYPEHRHSVRRTQIAEILGYSEIHDNLISAEMMPIDLLRCKLSFFGANKFDPRSDRWVRINMYQHAPFPDEFDQMEVDAWVYPPLHEHAGLNG